jgi:hypothetical protein
MTSHTHIKQHPTFFTTLIMKFALSSFVLLATLSRSAYSLPAECGGSGAASSSPSPAPSSSSGFAINGQQVILADENLSEGSCGFPVNFQDDSKVVAALGDHDFSGNGPLITFKGPECGKCIQVTSTDGSVKATVSSKCGKRCVPGTIEINAGIAHQINKAGPGQNGTIPVNWQFVPC